MTFSTNNNEVFMSVGIEGVKAVIKLAVDLEVAVSKSTADGKFDVLDIGNFVQPVLDVPGLIANAGDLVTELKDLSAEESAEVLAYAASLQLDGVKAQAYFQLGLKVLQANIGFVAEFKAIKG
jgi:hypothetical protein